MRNGYDTRLREDQTHFKNSAIVIANQCHIWAAKTR